MKSNAILFVKDFASVGVGAGQMSRVDSAKIAVDKAGEKAKGAVCASDAFMPFPDSLEVVAREWPTTGRCLMSTWHDEPSRRSIDT